ncbi:hypothetical protein JG687_00019184 [Phytophthora cactorum]|uniref:Uncharacterized protein n=1 Tax=Phytophthora cactorum TaxID=29920 RepID=A0A8T1TJD4_9STRA|nr:hypothetical protein JG687_00019184 [Phytophthora cactorum]
MSSVKNALSGTASRLRDGGCSAISFAAPTFQLSSRCRLTLPRVLKAHGAADRARHCPMFSSQISWRVVAVSSS